MDSGSASSDAVAPLVQNPKTGVKRRINGSSSKRVVERSNSAKPTKQQSHDSGSREYATKLNSELAAANKRLLDEISKFLHRLTRHSKKKVETLDEAADLFASLSNQETPALRSKLQAAEQDLENERNLRRKAEKELQNSLRIRKEYKKKITKLVTVVTSQSEELQVLRESLKKRNETNDIANLKQIYEAKIRAITAKMDDIEHLMAQREDIHGQLQLANQEVNAECTDLECQVSELKLQLKEKDEQVRNWQDAAKKWKDENQKTVSVAKLLETDVARCQTKIQELRLQLSEAKIAKIPAPVFEDNSDALYHEIETLKNTISAFENMIEDQSREICELSQQRRELLSHVSFVNRYLDACDGVLQELKKENEALLQEKKQMKKANEAAEERERQAFNSIVNDIKALVPEVAVRVPEMGVLRPPEVFSKCIAALLVHCDKVKKETAEKKEIEVNEIWNKKYSALMRHLDSAYRFLRNVANSKPLDNEHEKPALLGECARIGSYLEQNRPTLSDYSIFNPADLSDPVKVGRVFTEFVSEKALNESPIRELYTLFMCVTQVNAILMQNVEANEKFVRDAQKLTAQEKNQRELLGELERWKSRQVILNNSLTPILRPYVSEECENFEDMVHEFIDTFTKGLIPCKEREQLNAQVVALMKQIEVLEATIEKQHQQIEQDRKLFCKQADGIVHNIQNQIEEEKAASSLENEQLRALVSKLQRELAESQRSYEQFSESAGKRLQKRKAIVRALTDETGALRSRTAELQTTLKDLTAEHSKLDNDLKDANYRLSLATENERIQKEKKRKYKARLAQEETKNSETLDTLMKRNTELSQKYSSWVSNLESENRDLKSQLSKLTEESKSWQALKQEMRATNAQIQIQNRSLQLKVSSLTQALERERDAAAVKRTVCSAIEKAKRDEEYEKMSRALEQCKELMSTILEREFHASDCEMTADALISTLSSALEKRASEQFMISDARRLRMLLELGPDASLVETFQDLEAERAELQENVKDLKRETDSLRNREKLVMKKNEELERVKAEAKSWLLWGRSLLREMSSSANVNVPDVRRALEETLLSSIGHKSVSTKLEILRAEKKLLTSERVRVVSEVHEKVMSIRPVIVALIFGKRLAEMSGCLPIKFGNLTKHDVQPQSHLPVVPLCGECHV